MFYNVLKAYVYVICQTSSLCTINLSGQVNVSLDKCILTIY